MLDIKITLFSAFIIGGIASYFIYSDSYLYKAKTSRPDIASEPNRFSIFGSGRKTSAKSIELVSNEPPKLYSNPASKIQPLFSSEMLDSEWDLGEINKKVLVNFPDIESILDLEPPDPMQSDPAVWYKFALELQKVPTGKRYSNSGNTSPLLVWYVYIAKHSPETIYSLFNNKLLSSGIFGHLIQFGFLDTWWQNTDKAARLILQDQNALLSIIFREGETIARQRYVSAFFGNSTYKNNIRINVANFLFGLGGMSEAQKNKALNAFIDQTYKIDPRRVETLADTDQWKISEKDTLTLIQLNAHKESRRIMASFFTGAAKLGDGEYFSMLVKDAPHNDSQPTNFYCSACALALISDGLLGSPLIEHINRRDNITYVYDKGLKEYVIEGPRQRNSN